LNPDRPTIHVHLLPALIPPGALSGAVAVVTDVIRATTVMIHALAAGCTAVIPCAEIDEARRVAAGLPAGSALLGGERQGLPIEGFDLGNSPGAYTPEACLGKTLVMTTTNGTRAILASQEADRILVGAFVNFEATLRAVDGESRPIHLICAGTEGRISLEDTAFAGAFVAFLRQDRSVHAPDTPLALDDEALLAEAGWAEASSVIERHPTFHEGLAAVLAAGRGGRRVLELGLRADLIAAAWFGHLDLAAELQREPLRITRTV